MNAQELIQEAKKEESWPMLLIPNFKWVQLFSRKMEKYIVAVILKMQLTVCATVPKERLYLAPMRKEP